MGSHPRPPSVPHGKKRGPRTPLNDAAVRAALRAVLAARPLHTEGHRKVRRRRRVRGSRGGQQRVLRLMREARLLAPMRPRHEHGDRPHAGTIRPQRAEELWGTAATRGYPRRDGWGWCCGASDHGVADGVGWHGAQVGDRWAALAPIRQGVQRRHGGYAPKMALGLGLRLDRGPQYTAPQCLGERRWLGIRPTPSSVGAPEGNGIRERWIRTLKEEWLSLHDVATLAEARPGIGEFLERYTPEGLLERHGDRTPAAVRRALTRQAA